MGGKVPFEIPWNVNIHKGWFADTVPPFAEGLDGDDFIALLRIDSNLRSSAEEILRGLGGAKPSPTAGEPSQLTTRNRGVPDVFGFIGCWRASTVAEPEAGCSRLRIQH